MNHTVEEVREWAIIAQAQAKLYAPMKGAHEPWEKLKAILTAYADLLERIEADEEAAPFGYVSRNMAPFRTGTPAWQFSLTKVEPHGCIEAMPLFTRPPSQAAQVEDDADGLPVGFADWYNRTFASQHVDCTRMDQCERAWRYALASQPSSTAAEPVAHGEAFKICGKDTPHYHLRGNHCGVERDPKPAQSVDVEKVREVIASHIEEAKKLRHDPESQDYLYEQADKLEAAIKGES